MDLKELETRMRKVEKDLAGVKVTENEAATRLAAELQSKLDEWKQNIAETYRQEFEKVKSQFESEKLQLLNASKKSKQYELNMAKLEGISDDDMESYNWEKIWQYITETTPIWNVDKLYDQRWIIGLLNRWVAGGDLNFVNDGELRSTHYYFAEEDIERAKQEQQDNIKNGKGPQFKFPEIVMHDKDFFFEEKQLNWRRMAAFWRAVNLIDKENPDNFAEGRNPWPQKKGNEYKALGARWVI